MLLGVAIDNASATTLGAIITVAGNGSVGYAGDGGSATSAELYGPYGVAVDTAGNIYIADTLNNRIRKVSISGSITTVAGNGSVGYAGDGGSATSAELAHPYGVAVDASGNFYIADTFNKCVRKVSISGSITTVAGSGKYSSLYTGDGGPATSATIFPEGIAVDTSGNLYIADASDNRICKVDESGIITTVAGNGSQGYSGDGGPATSAMLSNPTGVAVDASGNLYIADSHNNCVRKVSVSGIITTVAGNGSQGYSGSQAPATNAMLNNPTGVAVDAFGNLYIADLDNYRVRKVNTSGIITTVAGNGIPNYSGDGGPAVNAELFYPYGIAVDASGNLYITDTNTIRKVTSPIPSSPVIGREQTAIVFTVGQPSCTVGGQSFAMDASPFISNGRVLVPVRSLADALGAQASWEKSGTVQKVTITRGIITAELTIGSPTMVSSGNSKSIAQPFEESQMDVAPVIKNGRTYLPARYVTDVFGCTIDWNEAAQTITISPEST